MTISGIQRDSLGLMAMQPSPHSSRAHAAQPAVPHGEAQRQSLLLLADETIAKTINSWPIPMPEQACTYVPRPGIETIKETAAEILRVARAIPRENTENTSTHADQTHPRQSSLDKNV